MEMSDILKAIFLGLFWGTLSALMLRFSVVKGYYKHLPKASYVKLILFALFIIIYKFTFGFSHILLALCGLLTWVITMYLVMYKFFNE